MEDFINLINSLLIKLDIIDLIFKIQDPVLLEQNNIGFIVCLYFFNSIVVN